MPRAPLSLRAALLGAAVLLAAGVPIDAQSDGLRLDRLTPRQAKSLRVKNVVLMIPDGFGIAHATLGRWAKYVKTGEDRLSFDDLACGLVRTYWATGLITDSAPAAAAMATGFKTSAGYVSLLPARSGMPGVPRLRDGAASSPLATVLEAARGSGLATGLVVTCEFPHATPAAFASHYVQRGAMDLLAEQEVYQGMDVVLGGGSKFLDPAARKDGEDLVAVLAGRGYRYVTDAAAMRAAPAARLWGAFAETGMAREIDRDPAREPELAEMTAKALEILSRNPKGFFLMVEGSQIDWAAHANDAAGAAAEILAFDRAAEAVLGFARRDGETAVVVVADHSTGGLTIGTQQVSDLPMDRFAAAIRGAAASTTKVAAELTGDPPASLEQARPVVAARLGLDRLTAGEEAELAKLLGERAAKRLESFLGRAASARAGLGWVSTNHGGEDVPLFIHHPRGLRIGGVVQNTDIAAYVSRLLGLNLAAWTARLFRPATEAFAADGAAVRIDASDPENPVLEAAASGRTLRLAVNKSRGMLDGSPVELGGVVVCVGAGAAGGRPVTDPGTWFVPAAAADLLAPAGAPRRR